MNGADFLMKAAAAGGVEICFANPGTTEAPLLQALDGGRGIKAVLGLFEGVCTGAADGYGRMKGKPAMTLLHLGPGFANGIANLHNARRAGTPVLNIIGEHATWHRNADPPLAMDIEALAGAVSEWLKTSSSARELSTDISEAISTSLMGKIASLIVPHDHQLDGVEDVPVGLSLISHDPPDVAAVEKAADTLKKSKRSAVILGGRALFGRGMMHAGRIRALTGCDLITNSLPARVDRGVGLPPVARIPYFPEAAKAMLSRYDAFVIAGGADPVTFFGYPGIEGRLIAEDQHKIYLCSKGIDVVKALECLADLIIARRGETGGNGAEQELKRPQIPTGQLTPEKACVITAALQPDDAIIVDEGLTSILPYYSLSAGLPPHSITTIAGGAIGYGMPCSVGVALACPDRPVINFQADGSGLYTLQALWTQAREGLNITTLIASNRCYNIVRVELERAGMIPMGYNAAALTDLGNPPIDWVNIAKGFGVPAVSVDTAEGLTCALDTALRETGPHLVEMIL